MQRFEALSADIEARVEPSRVRVIILSSLWTEAVRTDPTLGREAFAEVVATVASSAKPGTPLVILGRGGRA